MKIKIKNVLAMLLIAGLTVQVNAGAILWSVMENMVFQDENDTSEGQYLEELGINAARVRMINPTTGDFTYLRLVPTGISSEGMAYAGTPGDSILTWVFDPDDPCNYAGPIWTEDAADLNNLFQIEAGTWDGTTFTPIAASKIRNADDAVYINYGVSWNHGTGILRNAYSDDPLAYPGMGHWNEDFYLDKVPPIPEPTVAGLMLFGLSMFMLKRKV